MGDDAYSKQFGGTRIIHQDILHVNNENDRATLVGDISNSEVLPRETFDCMIVTQTLQLIYDLKQAVHNMHRALKLNGVLLLTVPGITQIERGEWGKNWYWSLTKMSASRLFGEIFGLERVTLETHGNVFAATALLQGVALEEVDQRDLEVLDEYYPVIISVRAKK